MLGKKLRTEDDRIKAAAKARKKKRKKMIKTKYGQKAVRHSKRGVYSCTYAVVIAFLVIVMILFSFMNKGNVNILMGLRQNDWGYRFPMSTSEKRLTEILPRPIV